MGAHLLRPLRGPLGTEAPEVALRVPDDVVSRTVVRLVELPDHLGTGSPSSLVLGVDAVVDDEVHALARSNSLLELFCESVLERDGGDGERGTDRRGRSTAGIHLERLGLCVSGCFTWSGGTRLN